MLVEKKGYYYLKTMLFFAFSKKKSFLIKEVAERLEISDKVMEQVLLALKNANLLTSKRGPQGGYSLSSDPSNLSLIDVMKRTGQKMAVFPVDVRMKKNPIDSVLAEAEKSIEEEIFQSLEKLTIKDLKDRVNEKITEEGFSYII